MIEILSQKNRKARKIHTCNYCAGEINIAEIYEFTVLNYDGLYTWKSHLKCKAIASELNMYDWCDEGVTQEHFQEGIQNEYQNLMSTHFEAEYESKDFVYPDFKDQLEFVIKWYSENKK